MVEEKRLQAGKWLVMDQTIPFSGTLRQEDCAVVSFFSPQVIYPGIGLFISPIKINGNEEKKPPEDEWLSEGENESRSYYIQVKHI